MLGEVVLSDPMLAWLYLLTKGLESEREVERAYDDMISAELEHNSRQDFYKRLEREGFDKGHEQGVEQTIQKLRDLGADESLIEALRAEE